MKNTKKYLSAGVVLAIALFASVQITAMENKLTNRHLTDDQRATFAANIKRLDKRLNENIDPSSENFHELGWTNFSVYKAQLEACKKIYYGDLPLSGYFTRDSLTATNPHEAYKQGLIHVPSKPESYD